MNLEDIKVDYQELNLNSEEVLLVKLEQCIVREKLKSISIKILNTTKSLLKKLSRSKIFIRMRGKQEL